jgi:hypothetical protein
MPTKPSRARKWLKQGKAKVVKNDLQVFAIQLIAQATNSKTQPVVVGLDPGQLYTGLGVVSAKVTLFLAHVQLPFKSVRERMDNRRMMRRGRRGRRINRKIPYNQRAHRQNRFDNRRGKKLAPSIRANRQIELRIVKELQSIYPLSAAVYEVVEAKGSKRFSPVMVGQFWMLEQLNQMLPTHQQKGWETSNIRQWLKLEKQKTRKGDTIPATHAVDGVALAASQFIQFKTWVSTKACGGNWIGTIAITPAPFVVIRRPPVSRRQLHLMVPAKGGVRRKYGGTTTRHGVRKGDCVQAEQAGRIYKGWVSGDTERQVSVSNADWKRLGRFSTRKIQLWKRCTGLIIVPSTGLSNLTPLRGQL